LASAAAASALAGFAIMLALVWAGRQQTAAALAKAELEREVALARAARSQRMEALGTLAGGVAHDVNNVLQVVLGGAMLIGRRTSDARIVEIADTIVGSARRGAAVTGRLLALAKRAELKTEALDAGEVLTAISKVLAFSPGLAVEVHIEIREGLPPLAADRSQLEAVLVNLASNGRDAMEALGGGRLTLRAAAEKVGADAAHPAGLRPGRYLRIEVVDTGTGMDLETLARAGEPFFTTKRGTRGTGLGLAMARGFAEQSGGGLRIASAPGAGTTVSLWLPEGNRRSVAMPAPIAPRPPGGRAVLLVDDEAPVRSVLSGFLRDAGHLVAEAGGGQEALVRIGAGAACDLLVADLSMPGLDGLAVIRAARAVRPGLPALLITGHVGDADEGALARTRAGGPFRLLRKPIEPDILAAAAAALLEPNPAGA
jgi:signal transduction histidine kinase